MFNFNLQLFAKGDTLMERSDVAKAMYVGVNEVFMKALKKNRTEEWKSCVAIKTSKSMEETYETIGNLKAASEKVESAPIVYGDIVEGNTVTLKNKTWANGYSVTMEAEEDEKWGIVPVAKTEELARTILQLRERNVAAQWDGVLTDIGGDGVAHASHLHPLINNVALFNDNLVVAVFDSTSYEAGCKLFNHQMNHQGEKFDTLPTQLLAHRDRQTQVLALLQSALVAFENSNTKNTIPQLRPTFNRYIDELMVHLIDESIDSIVLQRRKGLHTEYDYDKRSTFNWFYNIHERYITGCINNGFGFITIKGSAV